MAEAYTYWIEYGKVATTSVKRESLSAKTGLLIDLEGEENE
jgi:hypothetical protein